jgi:hypothetical protein
MKRILFFLLISCTFVSQAQINPQVGDKFIYNVKSGMQEYNFTIVIKSLAPDFSFAWQMNNEEQLNGKITIPAADMAMSDKMYNYFSGGDQRLKGMTSVLLSKATLKKLLTVKKATVYDGKKKLDFENAGVDGMSYLLNGNYVQSDAVYLSNKDNYRMTLLKNEKFPLIMSMEIGWSIQLSEYIPVLKKASDPADFIKQPLSSEAAKALWTKLNKTSFIVKQDLSNVGGDNKPAIYLTYYDYAEGLMVETLNDTVTKILYYPSELYHQDRKYYGAGFKIPELTNFSLNRLQQRKAVVGKFVETTNYDADVYEVKNKVSMEVYYHVPLKGKNGWEFNIGGSDEPLTKQKAAFVSFE